LRLERVKKRVQVDVGRGGKYNRLSTPDPRTTGKMVSGGFTCAELKSEGLGHLAPGWTKSQ